MSRNVNLTDYLGIPAIVGAIITVLSLLLSALLVWRHDRKRKEKCEKYGIQDWRDCLDRPILGSGAWTANDSWATNISTGLVVIAAVLGATTATNSLFPGVALDRFSIVNIAAGFFVVAAPVVFGILYSQYTAKYPGLTADATVKLPRLRAATISVPSGASITVAADTAIEDGDARWAIVRAGGTYQIPPGAEIQLLIGVQDVARACVEAAKPEIADVLAQAVAHVSVAALNHLSIRVNRRLSAKVVEQVVEQAGIYAPAGPLAGKSELKLGDEFEQKIEEAVKGAVQGHIARFTVVMETGVQTAVQTGIQAAKQATAVAAAQADVVGVQAGIQAFTLAIEQAVAQAVTQSWMLDREQSADAIRQAASEALGQSVQIAVEKIAQDVADGLGRPVPPWIKKEGSRAITQAIAPAIAEALEQAFPHKDRAVPRNDTAVVHEVAPAMAYSGGADIGVLPGTALQISALAGTWTVQASDVLAQPASPSVPAAASKPVQPDVRLVQLVPPAPPATSDAPLAQPVFIDAAGGAKVTVTGAADITLRKDAVISAPRRPRYPLTKNKQFLAPQGTNIIVANLRMILFVNIFTMFGIGAELGIAIVLAGLSDATGHGRGFIFLALAAVAFLVIFYAVTATRAMADPQPGSSISSQTGTSFTL
jgi:hypothetical protein